MTRRTKTKLTGLILREAVAIKIMGWKRGQQLPPGVDLCSKCGVRHQATFLRPNDRAWYPRAKLPGYESMLVSIWALMDRMKVLVKEEKVEPDWMTLHGVTIDHFATSTPDQLGTLVCQAALDALEEGI